MRLHDVMYDKQTSECIYTHIGQRIHSKKLVVNTVAKTSLEILGDGQ